MLECSLVIPVHNRASITRQCLDTLLAQFALRPERQEIIVVDDASSDITSEVLAGYGTRIRVIKLAQNSGFAVSCNAGAAAAAGAYVLFLNNDTLPQPGWLDELLKYAQEHPKAAVVGSKLLFPDHTIQHAGVSIGQDLLPRHIYAGFPGDHPAVNKSRRFQVVTGACMLVAKQAFEEARGFDTQFHNGYEDVDICLRLGKLGHEVHYCHTSVLYHLQSASRSRAPELDEPNEKLYLIRWAGEVRPDDFDYYLADRLIQVDYTVGYPVQLAIAPSLGVVDLHRRNVEIEALLNRRSEQVFALIEENTRLQVEALEARRPKAVVSTHTVTPSATVKGGRKPEAPATDGPEPEPRLVARGRIHHLSENPSGQIISILMPVKNGAAHLQRLLPKLLSQHLKDSIEVVAVDSGSTDDTIGVLQEFGATIVSIAPQAFNHGLTRNLAASYAQGRLLVFVNQDILPANGDWLQNLIRPLDERAELAGVCSRMMPRLDADLLTAQEVLHDLNGLTETVIQSIQDRAEYGQLPAGHLRWFINFHSVSMALRPQVLARIPFRKVKAIGEDLIWAKEALEAGFQIQYEPSSIIFHSHNYSLAEVFQRNVDDGLLNRELVKSQIGDSEVLPTILQLARQDWQALEEDGRFTDKQRREWQAAAFLRRAMQMLGQWVGTNSDRFGDDPLRALSLTEKIKAHDMSATSNEFLNNADLPTAEMRMRIYGTDDPVVFEASGLQFSQSVITALARRAKQLQDFTNILEFGCGCGRTLRWLRRMSPSAQISGSESDQACIQWLKTYLPDIDVRWQAPRPPLAFEDTSFDLLIASGLYGRWGEDLTRQWLADLARVAVPQAVLLVAVDNQAGQGTLQALCAPWFAIVDSMTATAPEDGRGLAVLARL